MNIDTGMEIPADGLLLEGHDVTTDESAMTGETDPMKKADMKECLEKKKENMHELANEKEPINHKVPSPIVLSGTRVLSGEGKMVVVAVGELSALGKINALLMQEVDETTPL